MGNPTGEYSNHNETNAFETWILKKEEAWQRLEQVKKNLRGIDTNDWKM